MNKHKEIISELKDSLHFEIYQEVDNKVINYFDIFLWNRIYTEFIEEYANDFWDNLFIALNINES